MTAVSRSQVLHKPILTINAAAAVAGVHGFPTTEHLQGYSGQQSRLPANRRVRWHAFNGAVVSVVVESKELRHRRVLISMNSSALVVNDGDRRLDSNTRPV